MIDIETAREMAMALPGTEEREHFGIPSFRVNNRIFSTLLVNEKIMNVKLSPIDQLVFSSFNKAAIYPVPNKWGAQGYTFFELDAVPAEMLEDALKTAWQAIVAKKKMKK